MLTGEQTRRLTGAYAASVVATPRRLPPQHKNQAHAVGISDDGALNGEQPAVFYPSAA